MGTLVTVDSRSFLLQRGDFPATLAALCAYIQENPDDVHDPDAVLAADNLPAALDAGDWFNTLDEHGDIVKPRMKSGTSQMPSPTPLEPGPRPRAPRKIEDQAARSRTDKHEPVWTLPKQPITFATQQVHNGQIVRSG